MYFSVAEALRPDPPSPTGVNFVFSERLDFNTKEVQDSNDLSQMPQFVMTFEEAEKLIAAIL